MDTAPRDGSVILVTEEGGAVGMTLWSDTMAPWVGNLPMQRNSQWVETVEQFGEVHPVAWMPLPKPAKL